MTLLLTDAVHILAFSSMFDDLCCAYGWNEATVTTTEPLSYPLPSIVPNMMLTPYPLTTSTKPKSCFRGFLGIRLQLLALLKIGT